MLTIAVSSRSLFQLEDSNEIYEKSGQAAYDAHMRQTMNDPLQPGVAFELVRKVLLLNRYAPEGERLVNVVMLSRNSPAGSRRIMQSVAAHGLDIVRAVFTSGGNRFLYAQGLEADLFLSAHAADSKAALEKGIAAANIITRNNKVTSGLPPRRDDVLRFAFDGDSVIFSNEADLIFREHGLERFIGHEKDKAAIPLGEGPFKNLLDKLSKLQTSLDLVTGPDERPLRIGLFTARGMESHERVLNTLEHWGINVDEAAFASGAPKGPLLRAFGADFFFDDTGRHIESAMDHSIPSGHVQFGEGGIPEHNNGAVLAAAAAAASVVAEASSATRTAPRPA